MTDEQTIGVETIKFIKNNIRVRAFLHTLIHKMEACIETDSTMWFPYMYMYGHNADDIVKLIWNVLANLYGHHEPKTEYCYIIHDHLDDCIDFIKRNFLE